MLFVVLLATLLVNVGSEQLKRSTSYEFVGLIAMREAEVLTIRRTGCS